MPVWLTQLPWKWILTGAVILGLLGGTYYLGDSAGASRVKTFYQDKEKKAYEKAVKRGQAQQAAKDAAESKDVSRSEKVREVFIPIQEKVTEYVQTPQGREECFAPSDPGAALMRESIDAANRALAKASGKSG